MIRATSRNRPRSSLEVLALAVCAVILFGGRATADLLVTRDGSVIETEGPWKVQGKLVIFKLPDGRLASLQLSGVDLDASRAAAEQRTAAAQRPPAAEPPKKTAVLVLTDADVRQAPTSGVTEDAGAAEGGEEEPPAESERLVVGSWEETSGPDGLVIVGELVNQSPDVATGIQLAVLLYDREGELLQTALATVTSQVLQPGQRARFRADVPGVFGFSALRFEAESLGLAVGSEGEDSGNEG
jgi:hypothetical protein